LRRRGLDGFIVPRADRYQNEYVPPSDERLAWLTGFTGSAGSAIVLAERAAQEAAFAERSCRDRLAELERRRESLSAQVAQQQSLLAQLTSERAGVDLTPVEEALQRQLAARGEVAREATLAASQVEGTPAGRRKEFEEDAPVKAPVAVMSGLPGPCDELACMLPPGGGQIGFTQARPPHRPVRQVRHAVSLEHSPPPEAGTTFSTTIRR